MAFTADQIDFVQENSSYLINRTTDFSGFSFVNPLRSSVGTRFSGGKTRAMPVNTAFPVGHQGDAKWGMPAQMIPGAPRLLRPLEPWPSPPQAGAFHFNLASRLTGRRFRRGTLTR
jgi:hypothetical protein